MPKLKDPSTFVPFHGVDQRDGETYWWAETLDGTPLYTAAPTEAECKQLTDEMAVQEGWPTPKYRRAQAEVTP